MQLAAMYEFPREFRKVHQALVRFLGDKRLAQRAGELTGYDPSTAGQIRFSA